MTFIYTAIKTKEKRGYNRLIKVWQIQNNQPHFIDCEFVNTSGYKGDYATACNIIADKLNLELSESGYYLKNEAVKVIEI